MAGTMVCSTIALVTSAIATFRMMKAILALKAQVEPLIPRAQATLEEAASTLKAATTQLHDVGERTSKFFDEANRQLGELDKTRADLSSRVAIQVERAELILDDTLSRVHEVIGTLHSGVLRPVREVNGIVAGIKTAFSTFFSSGRPSVERATQDEEMFI